jgi:hypothetical protein
MSSLNQTQVLILVLAKKMLQQVVITNKLINNQVND